MKQCRKCGAMINENAIFCWQCGNRVNEDIPNYTYGGYAPYGTTVSFAPDYSGSKLVAIISFLFWQIGVILWLFMRNTRPGKARSAAKGTLSGLALSMPLVGLAGWILWKGTDHRDLAKVCACSAIIGAAIQAIAIVFIVAMKLLGINLSSDFLNYYVEEVGSIAYFLM